MKPGLVGRKSSKAHRDAGDRNDNPPPIFCLGLRKGRRDHTHTNTLTHACPYAYMLTRARLNTVEAPCTRVVSSTHFHLYEVAPPPTTPKSLQSPILPFCAKDKGETLPVSRYSLWASEHQQVTESGRFLASPVLCPSSPIPKDNKARTLAFRLLAWRVL